MQTLLRRYLQGEHVEVWAELTARGNQVRREPMLHDALGVARETAPWRIARQVHGAARRSAGAGRRMTSPLLVDVDEAAALLSLSRRSVQQLMYSGALPSVKVGRSRRVAAVDLEAFVAHLRQDGDRPELRVV